jgi:diguanylate cyclase (GGDEF)-like protein
MEVKEHGQATEALRRGEGATEIPGGGIGPASAIGEALRDLARTLERTFIASEKRSGAARGAVDELVLEEVLDQIYESFRSLIPYDRIGLALLDDRGDTVRAHWERSEAEIRLPRGFAAALSGSSLEEIIRTGEPRILNDLEDYLRRHPGSDSTRKIVSEGMRSSLTCPLVALDRPIGFLFFSSVQKNAYREIHQGIFRQIAGHLSAILEKGLLYQKLLEVNQVLEEAEGALEIEATHDRVTKVWNRPAILRILRSEIGRARWENRPLTAAIVEIDDLERIAEKHGYVVGNEILRQITDRLVACLRSEEFLGRLGGDEFLMVLYPSDEESARQILGRAREVCTSEPVTTEAGDLEVTVSLGAAVACGLDGIESSTVLGTADHALYLATEEGRNRCEIERIN